MPVIIKHLIIKAKVDENSSTQGGSTTNSNAMKQVQDKEALLAACVEQVLEILEKRKER